MHQRNQVTASKIQKNVVNLAAIETTNAIMKELVEESHFG